MTTEKYVNTIIRKIKCPKNRRMEIRQQLLSDIETARENGEALEDIIQRMGSATDAAEEFNQNMPDAEKSIYTRNKRLRTLLIVAVIVIIVGCIIRWAMPKRAEIGNSGVFEQTVIENQAKWVVEELNENNFGALLEESDDKMKQALSQETLENARLSISDDWGDFQSYGQIYTAEIKQRGQIYALAQMTVTYENVTVTYTISFDKNMELAGLFMK